MRLVCVILLWLIAGASAGAAEPTVIVLSWDGIRWDYPDRRVFPALERMAREGVRGKLRAVYPSKTFPTHVSMATGTYPDRHGIMDNSFWDPVSARQYAVQDADWIEAEPVWIAAERQDVRTATYFWVGSESDWRGQGTTYRIAPFDGARPETDKVAQYLAWLDLPVDQRPRLIMSYWAGADSVGHGLGPDDPAVLDQVAAQDAVLQTLLAGLDARGLWPSTTLIIVSDHGMVEVSKTIDLAAELARAGVEAHVNGTSVAQIFLEEPDDLPRAEALLQSLTARYPLKVYRRADVPDSWRLKHPTRTGHLVVEVDAPYQVVPASAMSGLGSLRGSHGFQPSLDDMHAGFFALGRGVPATPGLPTLRQVDLAATIAALLAIDPPRQSEGRPMPWLQIQ